MMSTCSIQTFNGTLKVHQVLCGMDSRALEFRQLSCFDCSTSKMCSHFTIGRVLDIAIGDWVLVEYERKLYPGEVTQLCDNEILVNAMEQTETGQYKWPLRKDILLYKRSDVKKKISGPIPSHSRMSQFHFTKLN
ncbi:hypothetical protein PR048_001711 [Dryococelus australis]|uniref:Uncharacterized protein n=1 Tax=Dryococelus australis TaxID=614101 RepID=A0ABQ9II82_9NEOP|nr:hypothetical protein PR048_001711 [Dryococelus australis]